MVNFNPGFPNVFGLEWFMDRDQKTRVWSGAPARMQRLRSTTAETISSLRLSAAVDPLLRASVPTLIDIVQEGNEFIPFPTLAALVPSGDGTNDGWVTQSGSSTNLFQSIDRDPSIYPDELTEAEWIQSTTPGQAFNVAVNADIFHTGGLAQNARICWVAVEAILSANDGLSQVECKLNIGGNFYAPAGGGIRGTHEFGESVPLWWGEINPATNLPWTPADIANFRPAGTSRIRFRTSPGTSAAKFPRVHAVRLNVHYITTENRVAVAVWNRPINVGSNRLLNVVTDSLVSLPSGAANWSKLINTNYLFIWRQSVSPSQYGAIVADDVRWTGGFQELPSDGQPPGIVYPLHHSGEAPPPSTGLASKAASIDHFGRPQEAFDGDSRAAYGLVLVRNDAAHSTDSQPYRMDLADVVTFRQGSGVTGQRLTPASSQTYVGFRLPIIPPFADCSLTVSVHLVSTGAQVGGSFTATALEVGRGEVGEGGLRYLSGTFSSPVALTGGTQYEVRLRSTRTGAGRDNWIVFAPDCSLGPTTGFGSTIDGAVIAGSHQTSRDLAITLIKQPDPPQTPTASIVTTQVDMPDGSTRGVEHVAITWALPAAPLTATDFRRYELERQLNGEGEWVRVAHFNSVSLLSFTDHLVPRGFDVAYRIRQVARDGRISAWAMSNTVTPGEGDYDIVLTSNHRPDLEFVMDVPDQIAGYEFRSAERDEIVALHGDDLQVVFSEPEDRGVGWHANVEINFGTNPPPVQSGDRLFTPLLAITRAKDIPFCAAMDYQGVRFFGKVTPSEPQQQEPGDRYTASIDVIPTHSKDVPVEVDGLSFVGASTSGTDTASIPSAAAAGDLLIAFAFNEATTTPPTLASDWTAIESGGANACAQTCAWQIWDGASAGPAWTNATSVMILAYRGADLESPIGASEQNGATSANVTPGSAGAFQAADGSSWGLSLYGHATQGAFTPGFGTERVDFADSTNEQLGAADSNGGVTSWPGGTVTHTGSGGNRWVSLEIRSR